MKTREVIGSLFWMALGLFFSLASTGYALGDVRAPGPGFLPLILGILLIAFSLVLLGKALRLRPHVREGFRFFSAHKGRVFATMGILLAAVAAFESAGYLLTFLVLGFGLASLTRSLRWWASLAFAVGSTAGIYVVFVRLLKQQLPTGILGL